MVTGSMGDPLIAPGWAQRGGISEKRPPVPLFTLGIGRVVVVSIFGGEVEFLNNGKSILSQGSENNAGDGHQESGFCEVFCEGSEIAALKLDRVFYGIGSSFGEKERF
jgi:hypothetical protein